MWLPLLHSALIATVIATVLNPVSKPVSEPRGFGYAFCSCWRDTDLRENRMKPYIAMNAGVALEHKNIPAEIDSICGSAGTDPPDDVKAYRTLGTWLQQSRQAAPHNPFSVEYYSAQAIEIKRALSPTPVMQAQILDYGCGSGSTLSYLHLRQSVPSANLHCIELHDMVPTEHKNDFSLHILQDPTADLQVLSHGTLRDSFDVVTAFAVFHHIPDTNVRTNVLDSIFAMTKPGAVFLLSDWDSLGTPRLDMFYDVAHHLLWLLMGSGGPSSKSNLALGTRYEGIAGWTGLAAVPGFQRDDKLSAAADVHQSPLGGFTQAFRRPRQDTTAWVERKRTAGADKSNATRSHVLRSKTHTDMTASEAARPEPRAVVPLRDVML